MSFARAHSSRMTLPFWSTTGATPILSWTTKSHALRMAPVKTVMTIAPAVLRVSRLMRATVLTTCRQVIGRSEEGRPPSERPQVRLGGLAEVRQQPVPVAGPHGQDDVARL